jgi:ferric-dicitrate binding protein FerR (iron transport regulator)
MDSDKDRLIDAILPSHDAPRGFAGRVLRAAHRTPRPRRARRAGLIGAVLLAGVVAASMLILVRRPGRDPGGAAGHVVAADRLTVPLADRAIAVTEPGAELSWSLATGALQVEQPRGEAFYRVDRGGPFLVDTPAAQVEVTGTCFWVRVKRAALRTAVEVDVLEGTVLVRNGQGQVSLGPGGRAQVIAGERPRAVASRLAALAVQDRPGEDRAAALEARVSELERVLRSKTIPAARDSALSGRAYDLGPDDLRTLARRCEIRYYLPRHLTALAAPRLDASYPLDAGERAEIDRLMGEQRRAFVDELRALYIELTGERATAETLTPKSLKEEIFAKATEDDLKEARRRIFQEWLGQVPPPADPSTRPSVERFMRLLVESGPAFHRAVVAVVGPDRAKQLRDRTTSDTIVDTPSEPCEFAPPAVPGRRP